MDESNQSTQNRRSTAKPDSASSTTGAGRRSAAQEQAPTSERQGDRSGASAEAGAGGGGSAAGIVDRVRDRAGAQLTTQKDMATDSIGTIARAVRGTTQELRDQHHDTLAQFVDRAADQLERWSTGLKNKDVTDLFRDAQQAARRQPVVFVGSAFAVGLIAARFMKSSAPHRSQQPSWQRVGGASSGQRGGYSQSGSYAPATTSQQGSAFPSSTYDSTSASSGRMPSTGSSREGFGEPGMENR